MQGGTTMLKKLSLIFVILTLLSGIALAAVPTTMNYQGRLTCKAR
jgi:hypothetical protein